MSANIDLLPPTVRRNISQADEGCWLWMRAKDHGGYGLANLKGRKHLAHRLVFTLLCDLIPEGLQLDHLCRVRHCVNPDHMEPVTARENTLRGLTPAAANIAKTKCPAGHLYSGTNLGQSPNGRRRWCRACKRARWHERAKPVGE